MINKLIYILILITFVNCFSLEISEDDIGKKSSIVKVKRINGKTLVVSKTYTTNLLELYVIEADNIRQIPLEYFIDSNKEDYILSSYSDITADKSGNYYITSNNGIYKYDGLNWKILRPDNYKEYVQMNYMDICTDQTGDMYIYSNLRSNSDLTSNIFKITDENFDLFLESHQGLEFYTAPFGENIISLEDNTLIFTKDITKDKDTFEDPVLNNNNIIIYDGNEFKGYELVTSDRSTYPKSISGIASNKGTLIISTRKTTKINEDKVAVSQGSGITEVDESGNWFLYDSTNGLPFNYEQGYYSEIKDFVISKDGNYICTTNDKLLKIKPKEQVSVMNWKDVLNYSTFYKSYDFLTDSEITDKLSNIEDPYTNVSLNNIETDDKGNLFIGTNIGLLKYSPPHADVVIDDKNHITLYPNPLREGDVLSINIGKHTSDKIEIYDNIGNRIYSKETGISPNNHFSITDDFDSGFYNVLIHTDSGIFNKKLIIIK